MVEGGENQQFWDLSNDNDGLNKMVYDKCF